MFVLGDMHSILDAESMRWLFAFLAEMSSRQLEFGQKVRIVTICGALGSLESSKELASILIEKVALDKA